MRKRGSRRVKRLESKIEKPFISIFSILALMVLFLGFLAIRDFKGISVGKAYEIIINEEYFAQNIEVSLLANRPEQLLITVINPAKGARFELEGSVEDVEIRLNEALIFSSEGSLSEKHLIDFSAILNEQCQEYPCQVPIFIASKADGVVNLNNLMIDTLPVISDIEDKLEPASDQEMRLGSGALIEEGDAWKVGTSTKILEISENLASGSNRETIRNITTFIDDSELNALASGTISNSKGDAPFNQFLYLLGPGAGAGSTSGYVIYAEDNNDITADFLYFRSGDEIGRYLLELTTALESDVDDSDGKPSPTGLYLTDFKDVEITIFGKKYTIVQARRISTAGNSIKLILMSAAIKDTLNEGETETYTINGKDYEITPSIINPDSVEFTINGEQTKNLHEDETYQLSDGTILLVSKILYQDFAGGVHSATFYLGRDKTELEDENIKDVDSTSNLRVNDKIIDNAYVILEGRDNNVTFKLDRIHVNMTAEDDFYIPAGGRLSENPDMDQPEVLFTKRPDIRYNGLVEQPIENIEILSSGPKKYILKFKDGDGNEISVPLAEAAADLSLALGEEDNALINKEDQIIKKDAYLVLTDSNEFRGKRKTYVVQYKGADNIFSDIPVLKFLNLGTGEIIPQVYSDSNPLATLKLGGAGFRIYRAPGADINANDFDIQVDLDADSSLEATGEFIPITTNFGAEINLTNLAADRIDFSIKTPDDEREIGAMDNVENLQATDLTGYIDSSSGSINLYTTGNLAFKTSDDTNTDNAYTSYGAFATLAKFAAAPAALKIQYPKKQREALVYLVIKEEEPVDGDGGGSTEPGCETSLDCPAFQRCENGACVSFCDKKGSAEAKNAGKTGEEEKETNYKSVVNKLNNLGYNVIGQAEVPDYEIKQAAGKISFTTSSEIHVFDQQVDSFILFDSKGNQMTVQKRKDAQSSGKRPTHIIEFKDKPLLAIKSEAEKEFGIESEEAKAIPKNIKETIEERVRKHEQRLEKAKENAIKEMMEANPEIKSRIIDTYEKAFNGISADLSEEEASKIKSLPSVKNVYRNEKVQFVLEESVNQIDADEVWKTLDAKEIPVTGEGITIGIIDTGVDYTHADLGGCFGAGCKVNDGYDFFNDDGNPMDDQGHGTHVAATAAGNGILKGVAPDASIVGYKVLGSDGSGYEDDIIAAIERSVDPNQDGDFSDHLDIISMSLGGRGNPDDPMSKAIDNVVDAGIVAVIAAGNSGPYPNTIASPGTARKAITIGAVDKCDGLAGFSSRGPVSWDGGILLKPDVAAPGVEICAAGKFFINPSTGKDIAEQLRCLDNEHIAISGTSMATPHVSGVAALLLQAHPEWTPETVKSVLMLTSLDLGLKLTDQGAGRVNALNANNAEIAINPQSISFDFKIGEESHKEAITIKNLKDEQIAVSLKVLELKDQNGKSYDFGTFDPSELLIDANSQEDAGFILNIPSGIGGTFTGKIAVSKDGRDYVVPFIFEKLSKLTLKATGKDVKLHPSFILHNENLEFMTGASQDFDFSGNTFTFKIPPGTYTAYAIGEFDYYGGPDLEYILSDIIEVPASGEVELELKIEDAKPFTVKAESLQGKPLKLYQWSKGFKTYSDVKLLDVSHHDPKIGNQLIYLSNKPNNGLDTDILLYFHGVPAREEDLDEE